MNEKEAINEEANKILIDSPYLKDKYKIKITVLKVFHPSEVFENPPVKHVSPWGPCTVVNEGQEFIVNESGIMPEGFCPSAFQTLWDPIRTLQFGGKTIYYEDTEDAWIACCSDGLRPVVFKLERIQKNKG